MDMEDTLKCLKDANRDTKKPLTIRMPKHPVPASSNADPSNTPKKEPEHSFNRPLGQPNPYKDSEARIAQTIQMEKLPNTNPRSGKSRPAFSEFQNSTELDEEFQELSRYFDQLGPNSQPIARACEVIRQELDKVNKTIDSTVLNLYSALCSKLETEKRWKALIQIPTMGEILYEEMGLANFVGAAMGLYPLDNSFQSYITNMKEKFLQLKTKQRECCRTLSNIRTAILEVVLIEQQRRKDFNNLRSTYETAYQDFIKDEMKVRELLISNPLMCSLPIFIQEGLVNCLEHPKEDDNEAAVSKSGVKPDRMMMVMRSYIHERLEDVQKMQEEKDKKIEQLESQVTDLNKKLKFLENIPKTQQVVPIGPSQKPVQKEVSMFEYVPLNENMFQSPPKPAEQPKFFNNPFVSEDVAPQPDAEASSLKQRVKELEEQNRLLSEELETLKRSQAYEQIQHDLEDLKK